MTLATNGVIISENVFFALVLTISNKHDLTDTPAPRSPSLGPNSLSIMRTGIPFCSSDNARTRPDGPAPLYIHSINGIVSAFLTARWTKRSPVLTIKTLVASAMVIETSLEVRLMWR